MCKIDLGDGQKKVIFLGKLSRRRKKLSGMKEAFPKILHLSFEVELVFGPFSHYIHEYCIHVCSETRLHFKSFSLVIDFSSVLFKCEQIIILISKSLFYNKFPFKRILVVNLLGGKIELVVSRMSPKVILPPK